MLITLTLEVDAILLNIQRCSDCQRHEYTRHLQPTEISYCINTWQENEISNLMNNNNLTLNDHDLESIAKIQIKLSVSYSTIF